MTNFYIAFLRRLYNQFPRGYISFELFLSENTPFNGVVLKGILESLNTRFADATKRYISLGFKGYVPHEYLKVNWLSFTDSQSLLRELALAMIEAVNHRVAPEYLYESNGEGFFAAYKLFYDKIKENEIKQANT